MNVCGLGHDEIAYTTRYCPLCELEEEIKTLKDELEEARDEIADLKSEINDLNGKEKTK